MKLWSKVLSAFLVQIVLAVLLLWLSWVTIHSFFITIENTKPPPVSIRAPKTKISNEKIGANMDDVYLLAKIIHAEAKGEPLEGKIAVGNVILNRAKLRHFPDTVRDVIFQKGQFQPVSNGSIYQKPDPESIKAAVMAYQKNVVGNALYFYNPALTEDRWIRSRQVVKRIGNHVFAR